MVSSRLYTPHPSPPAPGERCVSLSWDLGSLPCSFPPSYPAGSGTGVTGTLRPGCFPINCYFLIPLASQACSLLAPAPPAPARRWMPASPQLKGDGTRHARLSPAGDPQPIAVPVPAGRRDTARCSRPGAPSPVLAGSAGPSRTGQVP